MRPRQGGPGARRKRRVVIDNAAARPRDARQQQREREASRPKQPREVAPVTGPVSVESGLTVRDLSQALGVPAPKIIMFMMGLGKAVTITQSLGDDEVELIAAELAPERELTIRHAADEDEEPEVFEDDESDLAPRPPVVTIMGHVDHGKNDAAGRDPRDVRRRDRGGWDHAAHRRVPGRAQRPQDHVPRHARSRGFHRDARARRKGHRHRGSGRRCG